MPKELKARVLSGVVFYQTGKGYYKCRTQSVAGEQLIHRAVWAQHHGVIPEGYVVHHINHDREDNDLSNLQLMSMSEHSSYHSTKWHADNPDRASSRAKNWLASNPDVLANTISRIRAAADVVVQNVCTQCHKPYETSAMCAPRSKYCSASCRTQSRFESGVDNETRTCVSCGAEFSANKYRKNKTCGQPKCIRGSWGDINFS